MSEPGNATEQTAKLVRNARKLISLRRRRTAFFDTTLFGEPAWDLLLDLYASSLEGKRVSISDACIAAAVPQTTALRWISALEQEGLIQREYDTTDGRRVWLLLKAQTATKMTLLLMNAGDRVAAIG